MLATWKLFSGKQIKNRQWGWNIQLTANPRGPYHKKLNEKQDFQLKGDHLP